MIDLTIATHSYLIRAEVEDDLSDIYARPVSKGYYYGIGVGDDGISAGRRLTPWSPSKTSSTVLEHWTSDLTKVNLTQKADHIQDIHQLTIAGDNYYICDTAHNRLLIGNPRESSIEPVHFGDERRDTNHINSVQVYGAHINVLLHNRGFEPSQIVQLDIDSYKRRDTLTLDHHAAHNVLECKRGLYYNASDDGRVIEYKSGDELVVGGHPKGMAKVGDLLIVGVSEHAVKTERRFDGNSELAFVDLDEWRVVERLPLRFAREPVGNVNEIRVLTA